MVALAQEDAVRPQSRLDEAHIFDQDVVQADDLIERELVASGLEHGSPPTLEPVAARSFPLDLKTRAAVCEEQETGRARDEMAARATDRLGRLLSQCTV